MRINKRGLRCTAYGMCCAVLMLANCAIYAEVTSIADWPCSTWSERRAGGEHSDPPQMWLSGYLTGLASAYGIDALAITDAERIFTWMDGYCAKVPDQSISSGALILFRELVQRLPRGPLHPL